MFWQSFDVGIRKEGFTQMKIGCTQMHADSMRLNELSGRVIGCSFAVLTRLGAGAEEGSARCFGTRIV